ncbi:hypothetical protein Y032_0304g1912 [Ancylostoma ceylanicum]|uniref:Uncharacterized protein n=1 Tax=Ancylostoma ceylanicum TaxID=53326 RepID=A0A016S4F5_9BILA|nr:hypothetical protein Y032_0304g1912 [Ancylostoma ceylanicum]
MQSNGVDMLASIPMPGSAPPPPPPPANNEAWEKAQQALKKTSPTKPASQPPPPPTTAQPPNAHALMMQYYPWMAQSYGMQYPPPPSYSTGYQQQQQNYAQVPATNNQQWNNQKTWNNQKQWNKRPPQQQKQPQTQATKKFTPFSLAPRVVTATQKAAHQPAQSVPNSLSPGGLGVMPENVKTKMRSEILRMQKCLGLESCEICTYIQSFQKTLASGIYRPSAKPRRASYAL